MKERKCESLFSFRRSNNRYSLHLEKPSKKEAEVQLKRASWSSFPLLKFSSFEEKGSKEELPKSHSSENVKNHHEQNHHISTPKVGCNFLRNSTASIRSAFSSSSSSSTSSSSSSPSTISSGSSGKSSITSILEGSVSDSHYDSSSTVEDNPPYLPAHYHPAETYLSRSASDVISPFTQNYYLSLPVDRGACTIPSIYGQEEEDKMSPTSPKIVFAHKKTPDVKRKSRKQLVQEYELMRQNGCLSNSIQWMTNDKDDEEEEKENVIPRTRSTRSLGSKTRGNFKFMQNYKFLSKMEGKYTRKTNDTLDTMKDTVTKSSPIEDVVLINKPSEDEIRPTSPDKCNDNVSEKVTICADNPSPVCSDPYQQQESPSSHFSSSISSFSSTSPVQYDSLPYSVNAFLTNSHLDHIVEEAPSFGIISDIIEEEEDSECDINEFLVFGEESSCFERSLEDKLEMVDDFGKEIIRDKAIDSEITTETQNNINNESQQHKKPADLKLNLVKPQHIAINKIYKSRLLRHISEEPTSGSDDEVELRSPGRSTSSNPGTPRSPAIDIDDVFKQKQKEIESGNKDDMSRVKDLATRLKLATRRPSYLEWLGTVKQKTKEMSNVLESHPPLVLEEGQQEQEPSEEVRKKNLQSALGWVRQELLDMRQQDQQLARQLMQLRIELQRLRLLRSCDNHQALVDEVTNEAEEARTYESNDLCEVPPDLRETFSPILREIGVTRMNITSRRFSLR